MDRLDAIRMFLRVAELGSFSAVAVQAGVARSVVTRQIAALETHLGVKLMARSTRRLSLTSAGSAYLEKCREILDLVELAEAEVMADSLTPRGFIALQVHGIGKDAAKDGTQVRWRNLRIQEVAAASAGAGRADLLVGSIPHVDLCVPVQQHRAACLRVSGLVEGPLLADCPIHDTELGDRVLSCEAL